MTLTVTVLPKHWIRKTHKMPDPKNCLSFNFITINVDPDLRSKNRPAIRNSINCLLSACRPSVSPLIPVPNVPQAEPHGVPDLYGLSAEPGR